MMEEIDDLSCSSDDDDTLTVGNNSKRSTPNSLQWLYVDDVA